MTVLATIAVFVLGLIAGLCIGARGAGRAYDRGQSDLLEQQQAVSRVLGGWEKHA